MESLASLKHKSETRTDYDQCIICQEPKKSVQLRHQSDVGLAKIKDSATKRLKLKGRKYIDAIERIQNTPDGTELMWHKQCYSSFTHQKNLARLERQEAASSSNAASDVASPIKLQSSMSPIKWELCIFCQKKKYSEDLNQVQAFNTSSKIMNAAQLDSKL